MGIDVGSTMTKTAVFDDGRITFDIKPTLKFLKEGAEAPSGDRVISTGYGRKRAGADGEISEIRAHVLGAISQSDLEDFTLLDIGGQDFKIIKVRGRVIEDFMMNDKCAAGTGRFLERMAAQLDMTLEELGSHWKGGAEISSVCTVFAETEIITRMIDGASREELAAGVNLSLIMRLKPYLERFKSTTLVLCGGGTSMPAIGNILSENGYDVVRLKKPLHNGALGCLEIAKGLLDRQL